MKKKPACLLLASFIFQFLAFGTSFSQQVSSKRYLDQRNPFGFIEDHGQFQNRIDVPEIRFGHEGDGHQVFLGKGKTWFYLTRFTPVPEKEEGADQKLKIKSELVKAEWVNADPNLQLYGLEREEITHTYEYFERKKRKALEGIPSFRTIQMESLYPGIDASYEVHPQNGIKYTLTLRPGADVSMAQLRYSHTPGLRPDGSLATPTSLGMITDHPPYAYYADSGEEIPSAYTVEGNTIGFSLGAYDTSRTVIIDPWTNLPNDPGSNWNSAWECETDGLGNSYAIFGTMPLQLRKYNAAGVIQWTYNTTYDSTSWLGTFKTDDAGNSYVSNGSTAALRKVSPAGGLIWSVGNNSGHLLGEYWNIAFNCDQTKLIVGGTGGTLNPLPFIYDINPANGSRLGSVQVHVATGLFNPSEVRAITATENAKYYWLTHDSIGFLSQSFSNCPSPGSELVAHATYGLSYKCEDWRYNNTGIEAIAYYGGFVYVHRGNRLDKRDAATAAIVGSVAIPGGGFTTGFGGAQVLNSGIVIDNTGNIFVGSRGSVSEFNSNLVLQGTYPVTGGYTVYDVDLTSTGELIACGSTGNSGTSARTGTVESLGVLGAAPFAMPCCDASICQIGTQCDSTSAVNLTAAAGGGTWSSSAPGFNPVTGVFSPATAGPGSYTFYYTLPCGSDSITIDVVNCPTLSVCVLTNGDLSVSGGTGPYTWEEGTMVNNCVFGPGTGCNFLQHVVPTLTWTNFGSGTIVTPPPGADTVRVFDPSFSYTSWEISTLPPCVILDAQLISFDGFAVEPGLNALAWTMAEENAYGDYIVEHSDDGKNWRLAGTREPGFPKEGAVTYTFDDRNAFMPQTWYRLSLTDRQGSYHRLGTILIESGMPDRLIGRIYPNPAKDRIYFTVTGTVSQDELQVSAVNVMGQTVKDWRISGVESGREYPLDISGMAAGAYMLRFRSGVKVMNYRVVVK